MSATVLGSSFLPDGLTLQEVEELQIAAESGNLYQEPEVMEYKEPDRLVVGRPSNFLPYGLTLQEIEVLQTLADYGGSYQATADAMVLSITTVKTHVNNIFGKFLVSEKAAALVFALREGIIK